MFEKDEVYYAMCEKNFIESLRTQIGEDAEFIGVEKSGEGVFVNYYRFYFLQSNGEKVFIEIAGANRIPKNK